MFIIKLEDGSYVCPVGFKNNMFNALRFKTYGEARKYAKDKYKKTNFEIREV